MQSSIKTISDIFGIDPKRFDELGVLNAFQNIDANFFVDPQLIKVSDIPEFVEAEKAIEKYFVDIIKLLQASNRKGDIAWNEASKRMIFRELRGFGIGTGTHSSDGSGIGPQFREKLVERAHELVQLGMTEPEMFEMIGLFVEGFGPDRLSDMTIFITRHHFYAYSERVAKELGIISTLKRIVDGKEYYLPFSFSDRKFIFLIPKSILRKMPIAQSWEDISSIAFFNESLRNRLNAMVGKIWKHVSKEKKKSSLTTVLKQDPSVAKVFYQTYKSYNGQSYDFNRDLNGEIIWLQVGKESALNNPIDLTLPDNANNEDIRSIVHNIINQFKKNIELNGLNRHLYAPFKYRERPRNERFSQLLLYSVADTYCNANNLDVSREPNAGSGAVDFKFTRGTKNKYVVEVKLSTNPNLVSGYTKQLKKYQKSENAENSIYIIILVSPRNSNIEQVLSLMRSAKEENENAPDVFIIDGRIKPSASKIR